LLEEIERYACNKPMYILGVILILIELGYKFHRIDVGELCALIRHEFPRQQIGTADVRRVMVKIFDSPVLMRALRSKKEVGLKLAYWLYR